MVEQELRAAVKAFRMRRLLRPDKSHDRLAASLDGLMSLMETPGQREVREVQPQQITAQPLPTGQIPDPERKEFSATN